MQLFTEREVNLRDKALFSVDSTFLIVNVPKLQDASLQKVRIAVP